MRTFTFRERGHNNLRDFIHFVVIGLIVVASVVVLQPVRTAEAQGLSAGCIFMNDPVWDSGFAQGIYSGHTLAFNQGEQIVVTAGPPESGLVLGPINLTLSSTVVATASYPGTLTYTVPANTTAIGQSVDVGAGGGVAAWAVSCGLAPTNTPPVCSAASANVGSLWPPNHELVDVSVNGVTDPDGDPITLTIDSIFQDEPTNGQGDGDTAPDGQGVGTSTAAVRAERAGNGNGRVYHIGFTADDGNGGTCSGAVTVGVPKSQGKKGAPVDDGATDNSTQS